MKPDTTLTKECKDPVVLPNRALTQQEVEKYWLEDRKNLKLCKVEKNGLVEFYTYRDEELTNG